MTTVDERREEAIGRLKAKRGFWTHLVVYVVVNSMLIAIWALTGAGYFWPIWAILGWGVGLALNAYAVYVQRPISEEDVRAEMERSDPSGTPL